jgi:hypothetical protein
VKIDANLAWSNFGKTEITVTGKARVYTVRMKWGPHDEVVLKMDKQDLLRLKGAIERVIVYKD